MTSIDEARQQHWDVIVVGTGMGGATLGYSLAKAGKKVLFCEKGRSHLGDAPPLSGDYAERFFSRPGPPDTSQADKLARAGRWTDTITDCSENRKQSYIPFIGSGTGGSSALYGMALERLYPADLSPAQWHPHATGASLPEHWPIDYNELRPYYQQAEALYRISGSLDPLRTEYLDPLPTGPTLSPISQELFDFLGQQGMHPYRLPVACEHKRNCVGCQGYLCARQCKNDSSSVCLDPAINHYSARLLDRCHVLRLESQQDRVTGVVCRSGNQEFTLQAEQIVLAAGALETPALLLRSCSPSAPTGLANRSGLVGRNLMRHYVDLIPVFPKKREGLEGNVKELAFNDFYIQDGQKLGTVQSFGILPPAEILVSGLQEDLGHSAFPQAAVFPRLARPILEPTLRRMFKGSLVMASIVEDLPYPENKVSPSDTFGNLLLEYHLSDHEKKRISAMRRQIVALFKGHYRAMLLKQAENNQRIAHVCGTCRFGVSPEDSVLDRDNRAHELSNLFVVDASFFPSSGGINPALTIAANALRVAEKILGSPTAVGTGHNSAAPS